MQKEWIKQVLDVVYPRRCPICGEIVLPKGNLICGDCYEELVLVAQPICLKCGKPIEYEEKEYCFDCQKREFSYEYGRALWIYEEKLQKSIVLFKYKYKREYAAFYVEEMVKQLGDAIKKMKVDVIIPVPVHTYKKRKRGYNQAELLADGIGEMLEIPVESEFLLRIKNTAPQKTLDDRQRIKNLSTAFGVEESLKGEYIGKSMLLVDDIYTTGSTIEVCTRTLKEAGCGNVYYVSLCIGKGY